jgi:hypothetical protein
MFRVNSTLPAPMIATFAMAEVSQREAVRVELERASV